MKKRKTLNTIAVILVTLGLFLLIGTAGALELDRITITQAITQSIICLGITAGGARLFKATYNPTDYNYEEDEEE
jgi:hypothetical protein